MTKDPCTQTGAQAENWRSNVLKCAWKQFAQKKCANMQTNQNDLLIPALFLRLAGQKKKKISSSEGELGSGTLVEVLSGRHKQFPHTFRYTKALSVCSSTCLEETGRHLGSVVRLCVHTAVGQERKRPQARELSIYAGKSPARPMTGRNCI